MAFEKGWVDKLVFEKTEEKTGKKKYRGPAAGGTAWRRSAKRGSGQAQRGHNVDKVLGKVDDDD